MSGVLLSLANPYFLVWWATVGAALVLRALAFGLLGFIAFGVSHWLCDFGWCYLLSAASHKGGQVLGGRFQRLVFLACGAVLLFFAGKLLAEGWREVMG